MTVMGRWVSGWLFEWLNPGGRVIVGPQVFDTNIMKNVTINILCHRV